MTSVAPRRGVRPAVTSRTPHRQLDQQPDADGVVVALAQRLFGQLPAGVHIAASGVSVPGARALVLDDDVPAGPPEAFLIGREYAHLHPVPDSSLHLTLSPDDARDAVAAGWAESHPSVAIGAVPATVVLVYAPRTVDEVEVVCDLVARSHRFASAPPTRGRGTGSTATRRPE